MKSGDYTKALPDQIFLVVFHLLRKVQNEMRHCERSEAIYSIASFATLLRNDETTFRSGLIFFYYKTRCNLFCSDLFFLKQRIPVFFAVSPFQIAFFPFLSLVFLFAEKDSPEHVEFSG